MIDQPRRRGRPPKFVRDCDGQEIFGLSIHTDGRYYATFGMPRQYYGRNKDIAVSKYRQWEKGDSRDSLIFAVPKDDFYTALADGRETFPLFRSPAVADDLEADPGNIELFCLRKEKFWSAIRKFILADPRNAARVIGIEELAWLPDLKKPAPPVPLTEIGQLYFDDKKDEIGKKEWKNSRIWWDEFCRIVDPAKTLEDLDKENFRRYAQRVKADQGTNSDSYVRSRFHKVKTILNHAYESADIAAELIARLKIDCRKPLRAPPQPRGNPLTLTPTEFGALLTHADDQMIAMLLLAMNAALYPIDIHRIRWANVDVVERTMVFDRAKKNTRDKLGTVRVATLWERTCAALDVIRPEGHPNQPIFLSDQKRPLHIETIRRRFNRLKAKARIQRNITFANIRDSATTVAARSAPQAQYQVLMGHVLPGADESYIRKNPWFVKEACEAIEAHYLG